MLISADWEPLSLLPTQITFLKPIVQRDITLCTQYGFNHLSPVID
jgi:hypothetical protein